MVKVGDFKGAIWLSSFEDTITDFDDALHYCQSTLLLIHTNVSLCAFNSCPNPAVTLVILVAIESFLSGSGGC